MSKIIYILVGILLTDSAWSVNGEPDACPEGHTGYVRDINDCRYFFACDPEQPTRRYNCAEGLYFNPAYEYCDFPSSVPDCQGGTAPPATGQPITSTKDSLCPEGFDGFIRDTTDCRSFFKCTPGETSIHLTCPNGLYFNPLLEMCDFPENVPDCQGGTAPPVTSQPITSTTTDSLCPEGFDGLIRDPSDCQAFFKCTPGKPTTQHLCPSGLYFDPINEVCDWPENVPDCRGGTAPPVTSQPISSTTADSRCPEGFEGFVRDPSDCQSYFKCTPGKPTTQFKCPEGLYFDPIGELCDWPQNVPDCQGGTAPPVQTTARPGTCPVDFEGFIRDPTDCRGFISCQPGKPPCHFTCVEGLYFNPALESCDFPDNVPDCQGGTPPPALGHSINLANVNPFDFTKKVKSALERLHAMDTAVPDPCEWVMEQVKV